MLALRSQTPAANPPGVSEPLSSGQSLLTTSATKGTPISTTVSTSSGSALPGQVSELCSRLTMQQSSAKPRGRLSGGVPATPPSTPINILTSASRLHTSSKNISENTSPTHQGRSTVTPRWKQTISEDEEFELSGSALSTKGAKHTPKPVLQAYPMPPLPLGPSVRSEHIELRAENTPLRRSSSSQPLLWLFDQAAKTTRTTPEDNTGAACGGETSVALLRTPSAASDLRISGGVDFTTESVLSLESPLLVSPPSPPPRLIYHRSRHCFSRSTAATTDPPAPSTSRYIDSNFSTNHKPSGGIRIASQTSPASGKGALKTKSAGTPKTASKFRATRQKKVLEQVVPLTGGTGVLAEGLQQQASGTTTAIKTASVVKTAFPCARRRAKPRKLVNFERKFISHSSTSRTR